MRRAFTLTDDDVVATRPLRSIVGSWFRSRGLPVPPDLDRLLCELNAAADAVVTERESRDVGAANSLRTLAPSVANRAPSHWLSVRAVADLAGVSPRTVSDACAKGLLHAARAGYGRGVAWRIDPASVAEKYPARNTP